MSDAPFTLGDDDRVTMTPVPDSTARIRKIQPLDVAKPIGDAADDDPLMAMIARRKALSPAERAAEDAANKIETDKIIAAKKAEDQQRALQEWEGMCPPRLRNNDWNHPALREYQRHIRRMLAWKHTGQGIYAIGRSGKGKSRALWWLVRRLAVDELKPVRMLVQGEIVNEINRTGLSGWLEKIDALKRVPILAWDDFGSFASIASRKDVLATELADLVDHRFNHEMPMLITSNSRADDLTQIFGATRAEPLMRRLTEGCDVIDFDQSSP